MLTLTTEVLDAEVWHGNRYSYRLLGRNYMWVSLPNILRKLADILPEEQASTYTDHMPLEIIMGVQKVYF